MDSTPTYRAVASASERLYEDERLRSNLADSEAEIVLKWATDWLADKAEAARDEVSAQHIVQAESQRVRAVLATLNKLGTGSGNQSLAEAVAALEPEITGDKPFTREEILTLLTTLMSAAWNLRG